MTNDCQGIGPSLLEVIRQLHTGQVECVNDDSYKSRGSDFKDLSQEIDAIDNTVKDILQYMYKVKIEDVLWLDYDRYKNMSQSGLKHIVDNYKLFWHPNCEGKIFLLAKKADDHHEVKEDTEHGGS